VGTGHRKRIQTPRPLQESQQVHHRCCSMSSCPESVVYVHRSSGGWNFKRLSSPTHVGLQMMIFVVVVRRAILHTQTCCSRKHATPLGVSLVHFDTNTRGIVAGGFTRPFSSLREYLKKILPKFLVLASLFRCCSSSCSRRGGMSVICGACTRFCSNTISNSASFWSRTNAFQVRRAPELPSF